MTYGQPLSVISLARCEQSFERVVARDDETSQVGQELAGKVEDDEEEVEGGHTNDGVGLGHTGLLLQVVEGWVLGKL